MVRPSPDIDPFIHTLASGGRVRALSAPPANGIRGKLFEADKILAEKLFTGKA